jgi:hypothetical protein
MNDGADRGTGRMIRLPFPGLITAGVFGRTGWFWKCESMDSIPSFLTAWRLYYIFNRTEKFISVEKSSSIQLKRLLRVLQRFVRFGMLQ